jgi:outer membrane protein, heavy metal efflux system
MKTFFSLAKIYMIHFIAGIIFISSTVTIAEDGNRTADTVHLGIEKAESEFLTKNLQLLASKFNISASEAAVVQARLWNNPNFSFEQNIYNWDTRKYFDVTSSGNSGIQIQQLITLAGKRDKQVNLAIINKEIAELNFSDLLRTLKYELRTDFYDLHFLQKSLAFYNESVPAVEKAIGAIEGAYSNRSILLSEILRLKSLLLSLKSDRLNIINQIAELENDLHVLLNDSPQNNKYYSADLIPSGFYNIKLESLDQNQLISSALENRSDYLISKASVRSEETNLSLQKSLAVPDLTVGGLWSRQGSYIPNYYALTLSIDLPIFNRNQGNIGVSQNTLAANKLLSDQTRMNIEREIVNAYNKALEIDRFYKSFDNKFTVDYKSLVDGMISNYQKRYITIIEFTDFYESYRNSVLQLNQLENNRIDALENLNYRAGSDIVKY